MYRNLDRRRNSSSWDSANCQLCFQSLFLWSIVNSSVHKSHRSVCLKRPLSLFDLYRQINQLQIRILTRYCQTAFSLIKRSSRGLRESSSLDHRLPSSLDGNRSRSNRLVTGGKLQTGKVTGGMSSRLLQIQLIRWLSLTCAHLLTQAVYWYG